MPSNDFNGDGRSDILWLLNGDVAVSNWLATSPRGFAINDQEAFTWLNAMHDFGLAATGDFNGDGRTDTLWNVDGDRYSISFTNPQGGLQVFLPTGWISVGDSSWSVIGTGDFNGDDKSDLLWRHSDGTLSNWLSKGDGTFTINDAIALVHVPNDWQVGGTGDFNGDGRTDIFWRSNSGMISNWLSTQDGGHFINDEYGLVNFGHAMVTIGDFNGDGDADLLTRSDRGELFLSPGYDGYFDFHMGTGYVASVSDDWQIAAVGDYNGDKVDDILWRYEDGTVSSWLFGSGGYEFTIGDYIPVPNEWQVADPAVHWL